MILVRDWSGRRLQDGSNLRKMWRKGVVDGVDPMSPLLLSTAWSTSEKV